MTPARDRPRPPSGRPTVDVVIVNFNGGAYLRECLRSLAESERSRYDLGLVVVVDNASTDGSAEALDANELSVDLIRNERNRGFAAGCNQGAERGDGDLILFLNPDVRLYTQTLDHTVSFMADAANERIGICGGQMVGDDGERELSCSRFPTLTMYATKMTGLSRAFPRHIRTQRMSPQEASSSGVVDQVIGAYFMIRRPLFEALGGFDERFFLYMEEVDLSYRAARAGYASYFLADVPVFHKEGVSSRQVGGRRLFHTLRSQTEYALKHWPRWQAMLLVLLFLLVEIPVRAAVAVAHREIGDLRAVFEAAGLYFSYVIGRRIVSP